MQSTPTRRVKEKGHRVRAMGVLRAVVRIFNEIAMHAKAQSSNRMAKASRASHGPRLSSQVQAKVRMKKIRENPKENPKEPKVRTKVPKAYTRATHRKLVSQVLKNSKPEASSDIQESAQTYAMDTSCNDGWIGDEWNDGWSFDEWNDDWSSVGWHEGWEQTYDTSASSFALEVWMSVPPVVSKRV